MTIKKRLPGGSTVVVTPQKRKPAAQKKKMAMAAEPVPRTKRAIDTLLLDTLKGAAVEGDSRTIRQIFELNSERDLENSEFSEILGYLVKAEYALGNHEAVMETTALMSKRYNSVLSHFQRAQSCFVLGNYDDALDELNNLFLTRPGHTDGLYLLCEIMERKDNTELCWSVLERLANTSKRVKTWHSLSCLVNNRADLYRVLNLWDGWNSKQKPAYHPDAYEYLSLSALRGDNPVLARRIWRNSIFLAFKSDATLKNLKIRKPSYSGNRAEVALKDLNKSCRDVKTEMFLVSGTLLGCVRENRLLGHDKDIDVGIWEDVPAEKMLDMAIGTGKFLVLPSRAKEIIRLKHVNGIAIDVFYHYREKKDCWHSGVKMSWHNTPFKLVKRNFLDESFLIPENYDLYLSENYGDWKTPKIAFDSAFDTPNGRVRNEDEMAIHTFKGLLNCGIENNSDGLAYYVEKLYEYGEEAFAEKFCEMITKFENAAFTEAIEKAHVDEKDVNVEQDENVKHAENRR